MKCRKPGFSSLCFSQIHNLCRYTAARRTGQGHGSSNPFGASTQSLDVGPDGMIHVPTFSAVEVGLYKL
jgi:hypothetical protein